MSDDVVSVASELSKGQVEPLQVWLQGHSEEDRITMLRSLKEQWTSMRAADSSLPEMHVYAGVSDGPHPCDLEAVDIAGKAAYQSILDLGTLDRIDAINSVQIGPPRHDVGDTPKVDVRTLTNLFEAGKGAEAAALLKGLNEEERIQALQEFEKMYHTDFENGTTRANLGMSIKGSIEDNANDISVYELVDVPRNAKPTELTPLFDHRGRRMLYHEQLSMQTGEVRIRAQ